MCTLRPAIKGNITEKIGSVIFYCGIPLRLSYNCNGLWSLHGEQLLFMVYLQTGWIVKLLKVYSKFVIGMEWSISYKPLSAFMTVLISVVGVVCARIKS